MKKLLKKIVPLSLVLVMGMTTTSVFAKNIVINGFTQYNDMKNVEGVDLMKHDTLLDAMGVYYNFDVPTQTLMIQHNDTVIVMTRNSNIATVNDEEVDMGAVAEPVATSFLNDGLYIPVEFTAKQLGAISENTPEKVTIETQVMALVEPNLYGVTPETIKYTYDEAVKLAIKNTNQIRSIENSMDTAEYGLLGIEDGITAYETGNALSVAMGGSSALDNTYIGLLASKQQILSTLDLKDENIDMVEDGLELSVFNAIISIETTKDTIQLLEENIDLLQTTYDNNVIKNDLGLLSTSDLNSSKKDLEDQSKNLETLKLTLQTAERNLNSTLGVKSEEDNYVDFGLTIEPLELDIDSYAKYSAQNLTSVKNAKVEQKAQTYQYDNYLAEGDGQTHYDEDKANALRTAQSTAMNINNTIDSAEEKIHDYYDNLKQVENNHALLVADYEQAIEDYNKAVLNYELGYLTSLQVDGAKLNIQSKYNAIRENVFNYETLKFLILHPDIAAM